MSLTVSVPVPAAASYLIAAHHGHPGSSADQFPSLVSTADRQQRIMRDASQADYEVRMDNFGLVTGLLGC